MMSKLTPGDKVAIISLSSAEPGKFPAVFELGLSRIRSIFNLVPIEFPTTRKVGASTAERTKDLIDAFLDPEIKGIISSIGGDDQVTYIKKLPTDIFMNNPKIFFGYSDNSHLCNFLWLCGIPSFYGGHVMTQYAMNVEMDDFTVKFLKYALFTNELVEIQSSSYFNEVGIDWSIPENLTKRRIVQPNNHGWKWDGTSDVEGTTWGGCLESIDEMLRHDIRIPSIEEFSKVILFTETSEAIPSTREVFRVYRALGERGILGVCRGFLIGRPKAWEFNHQKDECTRESYRKTQYKTILETIRMYNSESPVVLNLDFGHTDPQIVVPYGKAVKIISSEKKIFFQY